MILPKIFLVSAFLNTENQVGVNQPKIEKCFLHTGAGTIESNRKNRSDSDQIVFFRSFPIRFRSDPIVLRVFRSDPDPIILQVNRYGSNKFFKFADSCIHRLGWRAYAETTELIRVFCRHENEWEFLKTLLESTHGYDFLFSPLNIL